MGDTVTPGGLLVDGGEVCGGADALLREEGLDAGTVSSFGKANDEDKPADGTVRQCERWQLKARNIGKESVVTFGGGAAEGEDLVDAA